MESTAYIASLLDPARDLTVEAAQAVGLFKALKSSATPRTIPFAKLKALLDSRSDRDIIEGLKRVVSMIYQNKPCLPYFSSVVKNVANPNIEVKKLVYIYLLHFAEMDPDLALLSVNAIQKSLSDQNPQVRALALRTMSGMRVPVISQIVSLAIKRGTGDMSPHVRKAAALAIPKCYRLDSTSLPQLLDCMSILLGDKQYFVVGPAVQAFLEICPDRIDLIHKHYRSLVRKLVDMDEWGQLATLKLLLFYCRQCFPLKTQKVTKVNKKGFYDDEGQADETVGTGEEVIVLDPDLQAFLKVCTQLLQSRNSAVLTAVTSCFVYLGSREHVQDAIGPLMSLLRGPAAEREVALCNAVTVALKYPALFVPHTPRFLVCETDTLQIRQLKIELLTLTFPHAAAHLKSIILSELEHFSNSSDEELTREAVRAIGRCAQSDPHAAPQCFRVLLNQITSFDNVLVSEVLTVMRYLIQQDPDNHQKTVIRLARHLDSTTSPEARATIIWLVGEFAALDASNSIAPDVLRILIKGFADESEEAKNQIVLLAAKVYLHDLQSRSSSDVDTSESTDQSSPVYRLWNHVVLLARYDISYDLRDRSRLFKALLTDPQSTQLAALLLLAPKPVPHAPSPSESRQGLMLGSSTLVLGREITGLNGLQDYRDLPPWVEAGHEPDPKVRDGDEVSKDDYSTGKPIVAASKRIDDAVKQQGLEKVVNAPTKPKTLDDWLEESEEEATDSEGDEDEDEAEEGQGEEEEYETDEGATTEDDSEDDRVQKKPLMT